MKAELEPHTQAQGPSFGSHSLSSDSKVKGLQSGAQAALPTKLHRQWRRKTRNGWAAPGNAEGLLCRNWGGGAGGMVQGAGAHQAHLVVSQGPERFQASDKSD